MGSRVAFAGLSEARARVARLAEALHRAAGGEVIERATAEIQAQIDAVAADRLGRHRATGDAAGSLDVRISGSLVTLTANSYLRFHGWWPFRRGMPPFILKRAAVILAGALLAVIGDSDSAARELAQTIVDEKAASDAKRAAGKATRRARK